MLQQEIKNEIKAAMLEKNLVKLGVVRALSAAFTNELVAKGRRPDEVLSDAEALSVIGRSVKQRKDSISQFRAGGREDLVQAEEAELVYAEKYLPTQMSEDKIIQIVKAKMAELVIVSKSDNGKLMSAIMKELKGQADGTLVKSVVEKLLA